jgi:hypothetical protein
VNQDIAFSVNEIREINLMCQGKREKTSQHIQTPFWKSEPRNFPENNPREMGEKPQIK